MWIAPDDLHLKLPILKPLSYLRLTRVAINGEDVKDFINLFRLFSDITEIYIEHISNRTSITHPPTVRSCLQEDATLGITLIEPVATFATMIRGVRRGI